MHLSFIVTAFLIHNYKVLASDVNATYHNHPNLTSAYQVTKQLRGCYIRFQCPDVWKKAVQTCSLKTNFQTETFNQSDFLKDNGFHMCLFEEANEKINLPSPTCTGVDAGDEKFDLFINHYDGACSSNITNEIIPIKRIYINKTVLNKDDNPKNIENLFAPLTSVKKVWDYFWEQCSFSAHKLAFIAGTPYMHKVFHYPIDTESSCGALRKKYGAYFANCVKNTRFKIRDKEIEWLKSEANEYIKPRLAVFEELNAKRRS